MKLYPVATQHLLVRLHFSRACVCGVSVCVYNIPTLWSSLTFRIDTSREKNVIKIKHYSEQRPAGARFCIAHTAINRVNGLELICRKYVLLRKRII